jgi:hypothetical protein
MAIIAIGLAASVIGIGWLAWSIVGGLVRRPRLRLDATKGEGRERAKILRCDLVNDPVYFAPLTWLGVKRSSFDEIFCLMSIVHVDSGTVYIDSTPVALHGDYRDMHDMTAALPSNPFGLFFPVAVMESDGIATVADEAGGVRVLLSPGTYRCVLLVHADELHVKCYELCFAVGEDPDAFYWADGGWRQLDTTLLGRVRSCLSFRRQQETRTSRKDIQLAERS